MDSSTSCRRGERMQMLLASLLAVVIVLFWTSTPSLAAGRQQKKFSSPEEAAKSFVDAVRADDPKEMLAVLGPDGKDIIFSGDDVADKTGRAMFLSAYDQMNTLQRKSPGKVLLVIGSDNWPFPIAVVKKGKRWQFDTQGGKQEILNRRIGRNELRVMEVLHAYVDAQYDYATKDCGGGGKVEFAQRIVSTEGSHDGLYWKVKEGEAESPLGPLIARAAKEGYVDTELSPFHGYYYKILKGQGKHAEGGAYGYMVKGKMLLGFALVAYPAEYGNSGVMTFVVNQEGTIYQKNMGKNTKRLAEAMKIFDPDKGWKKVQEPEVQK